MGSNLLQYPGKDSGEYPPRHKIGYYDVNQALERRYQEHQNQWAWQHKVAAIGNWLAGLEQRLFHWPLHPKLTPVHRHHHR